METAVLSDENHELSVWQDLYMRGDDLQKLSIVEALPELLRADPNATMTRIIPKIQQELPTSSSEFHIAISKIFRGFIELKLNVNLLRPVLQGIESRDPVISNAWLDTLLVVIHSLPEATVKNEVLPFALKMSHLTRPVYYRIGSCKILGQIALHPKLTPFDVKKDVLPLVQSLCQDCLYEVRAAMCTDLPNIAQSLSNDALVRSSLLPCLVELSKDENTQVKSAAVDAVAGLVNYLSKETVITTIIPLTKTLCISAVKKEGDQTFPAVSRAFGILLTNMSNLLNPADCYWFLELYKGLAQKGLSVSPDDFDTDPAMTVACRDYCACNLPAVASFVMEKMKAEVKRWYLIFKDLAVDPCYIIRKTVAGCLHEIIKILDNSCTLILQDIVKLMRDDNEEVLDSLVPHIADIFSELNKREFLSSGSTNQWTIEFGRALLKCQNLIFKCHKWRRKMTFLQQLECLPSVMSSDFIHQHFTQIVFKLVLEARCKPVRSQAARTLLIFLRYDTKENHRRWIRDNMITNLCCSSCCYTRHIFIQACIHAIEIFSWKYFKEHFYLHLLSLGDDPVSNIRLCVVRLCPELKHMLILPLDRPLQLKLENFMQKLEAVETDKDVLDTLRTTLKEMRSPYFSKQDALQMEKRKLEEEDKIQRGVMICHNRSMVQPPKSSAAQNMNQPQIRGITTVRTSERVAPSPSPSTASSGQLSNSEMSFLDQHFYTDAGVALPEHKTEDLQANMSHLSINQLQREEEVSTVSLENTNVEKMSQEDLKELETSTTNITDDVKVNIKKISTLNERVPTDVAVRTRSKRYSASFVSSDCNKNVVKRRSLNIGPGEVSRIPVKSPHATVRRYTPVGMSKVKKEPNNGDTGSTDGNRNVDTKENLQTNEIISNRTPKRNVMKVSCLPVLVRKDTKDSKT